MALVAEELAELARLPDSALPLERMAALISAEHQGKVRAEDISDAFNQLAEEFLGTHPNPADPATLTRFIHEVAGFEAILTIITIQRTVTSIGSYHPSGYSHLAGAGSPLPR